MDRAKFFAALKSRGLFTSLTAEQVSGIDAILDEGVRRGTNLNRLAYIIATVFHETAARMHPVRETLASTDAGAIRALESAWKSGKLPWVKRPYWRVDADGKSWFGRGYVQITHRVNYQKFGIADDPSKALDPVIALRILFDGMEQGSFTGKKLADLIDDVDEGDAEDKREFINSRTIINGTDRASLIAQHALAVEAALRDAGYSTDEVAPVATQPAAPTSAPAPKPQVQSNGLLSAIIKIIAAIFSRKAAP